MQTPYSPPKSKVSDPPEPEHLFPKPVQIRIAVALLWLLVALALPSTYLEYRRAPSPAAGIFILVFMCALFAFAAFLNVQISRGRNWARIVFLVLAIISAVFTFLPDETRAVSTLESAISFSSLVLDIAVVYLVFSWPGALWFRPRT